MKVKVYKSNKSKRQVRTRSKVVSDKDKVRLSVFRSNRFIYAQLIDNRTGKTLGSTSDLTVKASGNKAEKAKAVGKDIARIAKEKKVNEVVFDRGSYKYHGRVKSLAEGAREGGLKF